MTAASQWIIAGFISFCAIGNAVVLFGINERYSKLIALLEQRGVI